MVMTYTYYILKVALLQGRRKPSPDGQAQLDVGGEVVDNSRAKRAAKNCALVFLAVRRRSHCTSASNWDSKAWKFSHTERKSCACALRSEFYYSNSRLHKCRTRNYVSTSAENGPAMAGPAGPVPAPMCYASLMDKKAVATGKISAVWLQMMTEVIHASQLGISFW